MPAQPALLVELHLVAARSDVLIHGGRRGSRDAVRFDDHAQLRVDVGRARIPVERAEEEDLAIDDEFGADLLSEMVDVLNARLSSDCIRLEISGSASKTIL